MTQPSLPNLNASYRLQLSQTFTLQDCAALAPYLQQLGISQLYLSPLLESAPGSTHGYDTTDFTRVSAERGGMDGLQFLNNTLQNFVPPLGMVLDIVPNHMGAHIASPYWRDVLQKGRASLYWSLFDMRLVTERDKIQLPILLDSIASLIAAGTLSLIHDDQQRYLLHYAGGLYPIHQQAADKLAAAFAASGAKDQAAWLKRLDKEQFAALLAEQHYAFADWRDKSKPSYRRFFDVNELIALRVEDPANFHLTHDTLLELAHTLPSIHGFRLDHIDGLRLPEAYLQRLAESGKLLWAEKILLPGEHLPAHWPTAGTTGYDFLSALNGVMIDPDGFKRIEDFWRHKVQPEWRDFADCVHRGKAEMLHDLFGAELERIVALSAPEEAQRPAARQFWAGLTLAMPVYRTYYTDGWSDEDRALILAAANRAAEQSPDFAAVRNNYLPQLLQPQTEAQLQAVLEWQQLSGPVIAKGLEDTAHYRYTPLAACNEVGSAVAVPADGLPPLMEYFNFIAAHYPYSMKTSSTHDTKRSEDARCRLYALADMPESWIAYYEAMQKGSHDCKTPFENTMWPPADFCYFFYQTLLSVWPLEGMPNAELTERLQNYLRKAMRENKCYTSNLRPNEAFENAMLRYASLFLADNGLCIATESFAKRIAQCGALNSLTALALKLLSPGLPDFYQGNELWDFSLVDPDNRRPVDFAIRQRMLADVLQPMGEPHTRNLFRRWRDGTVKLFLTQRLLAVRQRLLTTGPLRTTQMALAGAMAKHLIAYRIDVPDAALLVLAACYPHALLANDDSLLLPEGCWGDTHLVEPLHGNWQNLLTQHPLTEPPTAIADLLGPYPLGVFSAESGTG